MGISGSVFLPLMAAIPKKRDSCFAAYYFGVHLRKGRHLPFSKW
jgi:hypothetical protein